MPKDTTQEVALTTPDINIQLPQAKPEYKSMLANIQEKLLQSQRHPVITSLTQDDECNTRCYGYHSYPFIKHSLAEIEKLKQLYKKATSR